MEINNAENPESPDAQSYSKAPSRKPMSRRSPGLVTSCSTTIYQRRFSNYWSVENFLVQLELHSPGEFMLAPKFGDSDHEFVLKLFPNGKDEETTGYLSLFLLINKCPNPRLRFRVSFTVEAKDGPRTCQLNKNLVTINRSGIVTASKFFSLDVLKSATNIYIPNDTLTIGCELTVFGEAYTWSTSMFSPYPRIGCHNSNSPRSLFSNTSEKKNMKIKDGITEDGLKDLLTSGEFADFTVVSSCGREFRTHMCILSARSDYFRALLRNQSTTEFTSKRVKFEDISAHSLEILLRHIYSNPSNHVSLEESDLTQDLVSAVDRLMITSMRDDLARVISSNVNKENVITRVSMAAELRLEDAYDALINFFAIHKSECMLTANWNNLRAEKPALAIKILEDAIIGFEPSVSVDRRVIDRITIS